MSDDPFALTLASAVTALGETQLPPPTHRATAEVLGTNGIRYAPLGPLGRGGMGIVDHVWDGDLMRDLAVKRLRPELLDDPRMVAQFLWEARVGAYLDHPNIVPVHDLGIADQGPFFTMKRAGGRSLAAQLDAIRAGDGDAKARWPLTRRLRVLHQICQAIAFAHERGVLHRDLKPANILLGNHGEVLVTDWGLAVPVPGPAGDELRKVVPAGIDALSAGTPLYMSPEQAAGDPLDERSDVYTLGMIIYEVAALAHPREPTRAGAPVPALPRPLAEAWPEAPRSLVAVIERAMAGDPALRYPTVAALGADVERVIDGHTPEAEDASRARQFARYYMARDPAMAGLRVIDIDTWVAAGWLVGLGCGAAGVGLLGSWWWWWPILLLGLLVAVPPTRRLLAVRRGQRTVHGDDEPR